MRNLILVRVVVENGQRFWVCALPESRENVDDLGREKEETWWLRGAKRVGVEGFLLFIINKN